MLTWLEKEGETYTLEVLHDGDEARYFIIFADQTNGQTTYGGGRYLKVPPADDKGRVVLDFNHSYNPPCVFTPYATCPLPWPQNRLAIRVEAGELTYSTDTKG